MRKLWSKLFRKNEPEFSMKRILREPKNRGISRTSLCIRLTSNQTVPVNTWTPVLFNKVEYDKGLEFNPLTGKFVAKREGTYLMMAVTKWNNTSSSNVRAGMMLVVTKNGVEREYIMDEDMITSGAFSSNPITNNGTISIIMKPGDSLHLKAFTTASNSLDAEHTVFQVIELG